MVALLTRSLGQRGGRQGFDTFTVPAREQPAGRINRLDIWRKGGLLSIDLADRYVAHELGERHRNRGGA